MTSTEKLVSSQSAMKAMLTAKHVAAHVTQKSARFCKKTFIHQTTNCSTYKALFCHKISEDIAKAQKEVQTKAPDMGK